MDKKIAGLLGAVATLGAMNRAQAAPNPAPTDVMRANSFADLLTPIPNASALLQAIDESAPAKPADPNIPGGPGRHRRRPGSSSPTITIITPTGAASWWCRTVIIIIIIITTTTIITTDRSKRSDDEKQDPRGPVFLRGLFRFSSWPGHSGPKDGVASARLCPGQSMSFLPLHRLKALDAGSSPGMTSPEKPLPRRRNRRYSWRAFSFAAR